MAGDVTVLQELRSNSHRACCLAFRGICCCGPGWLSGLEPYCRARQRSNRARFLHIQLSEKGPSKTLCKGCGWSLLTCSGFSCGVFSWSVE